MEKMTAEEFRELYASRHRDFREIDLSGERVTGSVSDEDFFVQIDLRDVDFSGADLSGANFTEANFSGANLRRCYMLKCDFTRANFSGADLSGTAMTASIMNHTNFSGANLKHVQVSDFGVSPTLTDAQNLHSVTNFSTINDG